MKKVVFIGGSLDGKSAQVPALAPTYRAVRSGPQAVSYLTSDKTEPIGGKIEYDEYRLEIIAVSSNWKFYLYVLDGISMKNVLERILDAYHACEAAAGERDAAKAEASHYRDRWSDSVIMHTDAVTELADLRARLEAKAASFNQTASDVRAEIAALEREIGRAAIGLRIIEGMQDHEDNKPRTDDNFKAVLFLEDWFTKCDFDLDPLITRWRALHAAGAEAATGGGEAG